MIKVHPLASSSSCSSSSSCYVSPRRETFTVWMKSLVMQGNGCTVYNENGEIVYRIDNYDKKCSAEVSLMDLQGNVLFTILRKNQWFSKGWVGNRYNDFNLNPQLEELKFHVRKKFRNILKLGSSSCQVIMPGCDNDHACCYTIKELAAKSAFQITQDNGKLVAEAKRKQSSSGVLLGEDVLSLEVEPHVDHCLIMALVTVYGLIHHRL